MPESPRRRRPFVAALVALSIAVLLWPRFECVDGEPLPPVAPEAGEHLVRVSRGDACYVYDKRESWLLAKSAELFPNAVTPLVPPHALEHGGQPRSVVTRWSMPWWYRRGE